MSSQFDSIEPLVLEHIAGGEGGEIPRYGPPDPKTMDLETLYLATVDEVGAKWAKGQLPQGSNLEDATMARWREVSKAWSDYARAHPSSPK